MGINAIEEFDACFPDLKNRVKPNAKAMEHNAGEFPAQKVSLELIERICLIKPI